MKLGTAVQIALGVADLRTSLEFYDGLGFEKLATGTQPYPWAQLTDGQNLLLLNQDGNAPYQGLLYFNADAPAALAALEEAGAAVLARREQDGRLFQVILADPHGYQFGLVNRAPDGLPRPGGQPISRCGKFGEYALGVGSYENGRAFWTQFGFDVLHQSAEPYPWGILGDGMVVLGLHQTADFTGPNLTYFAPDMPARIAAIRKAGVPITQEMPDEQGAVANAILNGPDDEVIFLFQGEI